MTEMGYKADDIAVVKGSALKALEGTDPEIGKEAILKLMKAVDENVPVPPRDLDKPFMMPVESTCVIPGRGTVATGRVERGKLKKGAEIEFVGYSKTLKTLVTGIETYRKILDEAEAGDQIGVLVKGIKREEIRRGMIMAKPGTQKAHNHVKAQIYLLSKEENGRDRPISNYGQLHVFSMTWDCPAQVTIVNKELVMPGEDAT